MTAPQEGKVDREVTVAFRACNLEPDHYLWIVVYPHVNERFYPQYPPPAVQPDGSWAGQAYCGEGVAEETGLKYNIQVVLADSIANQVFMDYIQRSQAAGTYEGLSAEEYPDTARDILKVTVTRK